MKPLPSARGGPGAQTLQGIWLVVAAALSFAVLDSTVKFASAWTPVVWVIWFRYLFQAVVVTGTVLVMRQPSLLRTRRPGFQVLRGSLLLGVSVLAFTSVSHMPLGEYTAIVMLTPLAVTGLSAWLLKERVLPVQWALVAGGFVGALLIARPGGAWSGWVTLLPLLMVGLNAWFYVLTSRMARDESPLGMQFYTGWLGVLVTSLGLPWVWDSAPDASQLGWLALIGLTGSLGHYLLTLGFARAPASTLTPYLYAQIGFALLAGWWVFDHVPGALEWLGIAAIFVCGATGAWLSARRSTL